MENQTNKKFRTFDVGENFLLPVSEFDKRSPFDYRNLGFKIYFTLDNFSFCSVIVLNYV